MSRSRTAKMTNNTVADRAREARRVDREAAREAGFLGTRRKAGAMSPERSKAGRDRSACRGRVTSWD